MITNLRTTHRMTQRMRWIAQAVSTLAGTYWLLMMQNARMGDELVGFECLNWEMAILMGLAAASVLNVLVTWWCESTGGFTLILWSLAFVAVACVIECPLQVFIMQISGASFLIAGLLLLACSSSREVPPAKI